MKVLCSVGCGTEIETTARSTFHRVDGWEQKRDQGGANMIHARQPLGQYACTPCVKRLKLAKKGLKVA